jgi:hypothetical protein
MRGRHPHMELLRTLHVAEQRLLDGALGRWPARDPPCSARRRAMRAVNHRTVRPLRPRALPLAPSRWAPDWGALWQPPQPESGVEWRRAGERRELRIAKGFVSPTRFPLAQNRSLFYTHIVCACVSVCVCVCVCVCMCPKDTHTHTHTHILTHSLTHTHTHTHTHICIYICVYIYVYIYIYRWLGMIRRASV